MVDRKNASKRSSILHQHSCDLASQANLKTPRRSVFEHSGELRAVTRGKLFAATTVDDSIGFANARVSKIQDLTLLLKTNPISARTLARFAHPSTPE